MKIGGSGRRTIRLASVMLLVTSIMGVIAAVFISTFVMDKYNAYGEIPIPGSSRLHLPAGEVTISFHTRIVGSTNGLGLPVPQLQLRIDPPSGVPQPEVTESIGSTTTVNNDARVRVWVLNVAAEGDYGITTDGKVSAFINPQLAFGHSSSPARWIWGFLAAFVAGVLGLVATRVRAPQRRADVKRPPDPVESFTPTGEGIRIEQLKNIAALRDSGALTEAEFDAEKRRILGGR